MFQDTRPADLDSSAGHNPWAEFLVHDAHERLALLRQLRDGSAPVNLNAPGGVALGCTLWALDGATGRMNLSVDPQHPQLAALVDADEAVAVSYLDSVKLQFEVQGLFLVRGLNAAALQCQLPRAIYRFQRRGAYRVRVPERHTPTARLRHPAMPDMVLALRVLDVSIGGCALWLPDDVPALQAGTTIGQVEVTLDMDTRFSTAMTLQHVSALGADARGVRLGCEWSKLSAGADRVLVRWIDQAQRRRRLLSL